MPKIPAKVVVAIAALAAAMSVGVGVGGRARALDARGDCEALARSGLPRVQIDRARMQDAFPSARAADDGRTGSARAPFCRIEGRIEGNIGFEVWLPRRGEWRGRFLGAGVGGSGGMFNFADMARGVNQGFATTSTDTGHKASETAWMMDAKKADDYAHRAVHLTTLAAKALATSFYGRAPTRSYFLGCSGGGRQALKEMQRYPKDYDGIVAGAPGPYQPISMARKLWVAQIQARHPEGGVTDAEWGLVAQGAVDQCDRLDGVADGVLEDPRACKLNLSALACRPGRAQSCLSPAKVELIGRIYAPLRDETGRKLDLGLLPGVRTRPGPPPSNVIEGYGQVVHGKADWDQSDFVISRDLAALNRKLPELAAADTDLSAFAARGGKAIIYQGWLDASVNAGPTVSYFEAAEARNGGRAKARSFLRLMMVPGMFHCSGGPGTDRFGGSGRQGLSVDPDHDLLSAMVAWVETGRAPDRLVAAKVAEGVSVRTRPLCIYPKAARYDGSGDTDDAANFTCQSPRPSAGPSRRSGGRPVER